MLDHGEIVRDEQIREAELALQIDQQVDDLCLHRDVERRDRLVADDQFRPRRQRPRDAETLALSAGEFVRVLGHLVGAQADPLEERKHPFVDLRRRVLLEIADRFRDDIRRAHARVERRIGILEHGLHLAAVRPHGAAPELIDALPSPADRPRRRRDQPQHGLAQRGLAAATLADKAERLALGDREA